MLKKNYNNNIPQRLFFHFFFSHFFFIFSRNIVDMESIAKFMLYSLKQIPQDILNSVNNQEPDPCYACNGPILQKVFGRNMALILLPCGHIHHDRCIKALRNGSRCPFPFCTEIIESTVPNLTNMQTMQAMQTMQTTIQNINIQNNIQPQQVIQQPEPQTLYYLFSIMSQVKCFYLN
jgi:hypothetical protein